MKSTSPPAPVTARPVATPGNGGALGRLRLEPGPTQVPLQVLGPHPYGRTGRTNLDRDLAQDLGQRPLQLSHARLAGVRRRDLPQSLVVDAHLVGGHAGAVELTRPQVVAGDRDLLALGVAVERDCLHPVQQRAGDGVGHVGGGQEQHVRQVQVDLEVVVAERVVLRRVEHLEQGRGRVTGEAHGELVHLVEQHHRIHRAGLADGPDDPAGQRTNVGTSVTPDLGLVPDTAQRYPDELAAQRPRHGLAQARLADAGRPDQGQYGAGAPTADHLQVAAGAAVAHREVLQDPVLHVRRGRRGQRPKWTEPR